MQRYRWQGHEMQLLGELQRQQNNAQFCDTLLQTEGISVPTHSCILAALSPYLSQRLSASPPPPSGQKRQLQLQAVKAQTLLKLVSLLYSGELEVKGGVEQNDVLSAACQFGITDFLEGRKDGGMEGGELQKKRFGSCREKGGEEGRERNESRKMQNVQVQAKVARRRGSDSPVEKRSCVSTGTQTVEETHSGQNKPPTPEPASSVAPSLDFFIPLQPQNIPLETHFCSTFLPPIPSVPSGAPSDGESALHPSSDGVTNPKSTSALSSSAMTFPVSLRDGSSSPTPQEEPSEFGDSTQALAEEGTGLDDGKTADSREHGEQPSHASRDEMLGEEKGNPTAERRAKVGVKSLAKMKQMQRMMETTQISIKVKLRRRTKGEAWEVVSVHDTDETLAARTSRKQDVSNHKRPQTDLRGGEPPPSSVQQGPIHKLILQPAAVNSHAEPAPHPNTASDAQRLPRDRFTPNQNNRPESVPLPQPPGPAEESDEQIEKLLDDIMMGLNILPNLERFCKKSHHLPPGHDGAPALCPVPATENDRAQSQVPATVSAAGCVYCQDFGTQIGHSSTDAAENQPSCSSLSSAQPDAVLIQQQLQHSPQYHSSVTSVGQRDGTSHQGLPLSNTQNCPCPEAPTTTSDIPTACYPSEQQLHYPACQEPSSQDAQNKLELLPLTNGNEAQSSFSLPCMDDFRLPRCLSPLQPSPSAAKHQPVLSNSTSHGGNLQPRPSPQGRPWLAEIPGSLQFPLSAIAHGEDERASLPADTNRRCRPKQWQKHLELHPQNGGTWAESCAVKEVKKRGTISAGCENATGLKSDPRKEKESSKCRQGEATAPKTRTRSHPLDAAGSLLAWKDVRVSDGTKRQINLSVCSVSLSSNNVLAKEREMATGSSTVPNKFVGRPSEPSAITESRRGNTRGTVDLNSGQTRIRTRGFLKKTEETPSNTGQPAAHTANIVCKQEALTPKHKAGRPRKTELEKSSPTVIEKKSHNVESEQQIDNNLPKEEEAEKAKTRCKKRRRKRSEVEEIPLKKTISAASTAEKLGTPRRPQAVTLKEFQKFIERQHSKTRKSKESQEKDANETARDVEEDLTKETDMDTDITRPQNRDGIEESHVIVNVAVDKNHNQIFNKSTAEYSESQRDGTNSSTGKETGVSADEYHPAFSFDLLGEEVTKLAAEREQPLTSPGKAQKACDAGVSATVRCVVPSSWPCCDAHLPQEDKMPSDHNFDPQTPERTGRPLSDAVGLSRSSGCDQEEDEEEVDVLLYTPDKRPQNRECENGLDNMDITPEEEEEEDVNEIDVTGDEAE